MEGMAEADQNVLKMRVGDEFTFGINVKDLLECPVCLKLMYDAPIFRCENDHAMCKTCHGRLLQMEAKCPVCRSGTIAADKRSRILESIVARFPKTPCRHPGCAHAMTDPYELGEHEAHDCPHRPRPCPVCREPVAMSGMPQHLNCVHYGTVGHTYGTRMKLACKKNEVGEQVIRLSDEDKSNEQTFTLRRVMRDVGGSPCLLAWVAQDGLTNAGNFDSDFEFTLALADSNGCGGEIMSISAHCSPADVAKGVACLYLSPYTIDEATNDMDYHVIHVTVNKSGTILRAIETRAEAEAVSDASSSDEEEEVGQVYLDMAE